MPITPFYPADSHATAELAACDGESHSNNHGFLYEGSDTATFGFEKTVTKDEHSLPHAIAEMGN